MPSRPIRIVTAASLFDGHDASINIIRRVLQDAGAEVIHLGHNRSVMEIVVAALQEGAQGICVSSYQGGHMEFFKYMKDLLNGFGAPYIKVYGGGGGVIIHEEQQELLEYGVKTYHPDDGRRLGLEGMIKEIIAECDFDLLEAAASVKDNKYFSWSDPQIADRLNGLALTAVEDKKEVPDRCLQKEAGGGPIVIGVTGTGGAGKSSLVDELIQRFLNVYKDCKIAVLSVDPTKRKTGGALLGDRIRMNSLQRPGVFMRSIATRGSGKEVSESLPALLSHTKKQNYNVIFVETSGIGQADASITELGDLNLYVMTSEFGAQSQLEKIDMLDFADLIAINKADRRGSQDALRDVRKQYSRSRKLFSPEEQKELPVYLTQASHFNNEGVNELFLGLTKKMSEKNGSYWQVSDGQRAKLRSSQQHQVIPSERQNYLSEIVRSVRKYKERTSEAKEIASKLYSLNNVKDILKSETEAVKAFEDLKQQLSEEEWKSLENWDKLKNAYAGDEFSYSVRGKEIRQELVRETLAGSRIPRVILPDLKDWGDRIEFLRQENVPGCFPFTAGVFPLKRTEEEPKRQFAGEGTPERTNRRFHYLSRDDKAKRLSTAFDSVTLYGQDPNERPDIYGKVGESGVSICTLEDIKKLYHDFDFTSPSTSISMTINGPAPIMLAFFMNAVIDYNVEKQEKAKGGPLSPEEWNAAREKALQTVRGTVQADILKEDQAQNTCIFSTEFALKMMGDIQEFFSQEKVRNFYSVSISGYHIAEAGANPISQTAFTLANGFTYVEYYLSRGMKIDNFAPNLSFFFSNGLDAEYSVIGRVARRIWSIAMRDLYSANERSQKLKYHIQTSGRSLHAQEIAFNDIRTTLQALLALEDNCNSLHTNAYDEAITTPTEESVRRAMAIQMIINREFGIAKNENSLQGSYFYNYLTNLVEEAILDEFMRISERGGVLGAMETQYQRSKIQEESLYYEHLKHSGDLPIIGVNTYIDPQTLKEGYVPPKIELARATAEEKKQQLDNLLSFQEKNKDRAESELKNLKDVALSGGNIFAALMTAARYCSLGQCSQALYEVGGQYRRSL
jgi:methylmalonyl-CoA mutase